MAGELINPYTAELRQLADACESILTMDDAGRVLVYVEVGFNTLTEEGSAVTSYLIEDELGLPEERPEGTPFGDPELVASAARTSERHFDRFVGRQVLDLGWTALPGEVTANIVPMVDRSVGSGTTDDEEGGYVGISELYLSKGSKPDSAQYSVGVATDSDGYYHGNFIRRNDDRIVDVAFTYLSPAARACLTECEAFFGDNSEAARLVEGYFASSAELNEGLRLMRESVEGIYPAELIDSLLERVRQEALAAKRANGEHGGVTPERLARLTRFVLSMRA